VLFVSPAQPHVPGIQKSGQPHFPAVVQHAGPAAMLQVGQDVGLQLPPEFAAPLPFEEPPCEPRRPPEDDPPIPMGGMNPAPPDEEEEPPPIPCPGVPPGASGVPPAPVEGTPPPLPGSMLPPTPAGSPPPAPRPGSPPMDTLPPGPESTRSAGSKPTTLAQAVVSSTAQSHTDFGCRISAEDLATAGSVPPGLQQGSVKACSGGLCALRIACRFAS